MGHHGVMENVSIHHAPEHSRYELRLDGETIGLAQYRDGSGARDFTHTEVDKEHQGHGLATDLIRFALDDTRASGLHVIATCPMVADFVAENPAYADGGATDEAGPGAGE